MDGELDENGWAVGRVDAWPIAGAWSLISPEPHARIDAARWAHQATTFFGATLAVLGEKLYPSGTTPLVDRVSLEIAPARTISRYRAPGIESSAPTRIELITLPLDRAPAVLEAAGAAVAAIGGAGFDALLARGRRLWQIDDRVAEGGDPRAPLVAAAVLASVLLAPIVPPGGGAIFGVKGARERLAQRGWRA